MEKNALPLRVLLGLGFMLFSCGVHGADAPPPPVQVEIVTPNEDNPHALRPDDHSPMAEHLRAAQKAAGAIKASLGYDRATESSDRLLARQAAALYFKAVRAADLTNESPSALTAPAAEHLSWPSLIAWIGAREEMDSALCEAVQKCPERKLSWSALALIHISMPSPELSPHQEPWKLMDLLTARQPQVLATSVTEWVATMRTLNSLGRHEEAVKLARAIALAPEPVVPLPERMDYQVQIYSGIQDRKRPDLMKPLLRFALEEKPEEFTRRLLEVARQNSTQPTAGLFWLEAEALRGLLRPDDLEIARAWPPTEKLSAALQRLADADAQQPRDLLIPWLKEGISELYSGRELPEKQNRESLETDVIRSMPRLRFPGLADHVRQQFPAWLHSLHSSGAEQFDPPQHWVTLAQLTFAFGSEAQRQEIIDHWRAECDRCMKPEPNGYAEEHLSLLAQSALLMPAALSKEMATHAAALLEAVSIHLASQGQIPQEHRTRHVLRALLVTGQDEKLESLASVLEHGLATVYGDSHRHDNEFATLILQYRSLHGVLLGRAGYLPEVVAWTRNGKTAQDPPEIVWEFVAPLHVPPNFPGVWLKMIGATPQGSNRLWSVVHRPGGLRSPLLQRLSGRYDLTFEIGTALDPFDKDTLKPVAQVPLAAAHGAVTLSAMPPLSGYLTVVLTDRATGQQVSCPERVYSLEPPVLASGPEPDGGWGSPTMVASPEYWPGPMQDTLRANLQKAGDGLPVTAPVSLNPKQRFLFTCWHPWDAEEDGVAAPAPAVSEPALVFLDTLMKPIGGSSNSNLINAGQPYLVAAARYDQTIYAPQDLFAPDDYYPGDPLPPQISQMMILVRPPLKTSSWPLYQIRPIHLEPAQP